MITYNKTLNSNVIENLTYLLNTEFEGTPIRYDDRFNGNQYFKITPIEDNVIDLRTDGVIREYSIEIQYTQKQVGRFTKRKSLDKRINTVERLKEILRQNTASVEEVLYLKDAAGNDFITSDDNNFVIIKRPILMTSQDQYFITADPAAFTLESALQTYEWHQAQLDSVVYDVVSDRPNYLTATVEFKCLVEEVYA